MHAIKNPLAFSSSPPPSSMTPPSSMLGMPQAPAASKATHRMSSSPGSGCGGSPGRRLRLDDHAQLKQNLNRHGAGAITPMRPKKRPSLRNVLASPGSSNRPTLQLTLVTSTASKTVGLPEPVAFKSKAMPPPAGVKLSRKTAPGQALRKPIPASFFHSNGDAVPASDPSLGGAAKVRKIQVPRKPASGLFDDVFCTSRSAAKGDDQVEGRSDVVPEPVYGVVRDAFDSIDTADHGDTFGHRSPALRQVKLVEGEAAPNQRLDLDLDSESKETCNLIDVQGTNTPTRPQQQESKPASSPLVILSKILQSFTEPASNADEENVFASPCASILDRLADSDQQQRATEGWGESHGEDRVRVPFPLALLQTTGWAHSLTLLPVFGKESSTGRSTTSTATPSPPDQEPFQSKEPLSSEVGALPAAKSTRISVCLPEAEALTAPISDSDSSIPSGPAVGGSLPATANMTPKQSFPFPSLPPTIFSSPPLPGHDWRRSPPSSCPSTFREDAPDIIITPAPLTVSSTYPVVDLLRHAMFDFSPELLEDRHDDAEDTYRDINSELAGTLERGNSSSPLASAPSGLAQGIVDVISEPSGPTNKFGNVIADSSTQISEDKQHRIWDEGIARIIRRRNLDDAKAFVELSTFVDELLSDFLNFKHIRHLQLTCDELVGLLSIASHPYNDRGESHRLNGVDAHLVSPAGLRGEPILLPPYLDQILSSQERLRRIALVEAYLHLQAIEKLFEIIVTGFSCLLADSRLQHQGTQAMALFCRELYRRSDGVLRIYPTSGSTPSDRGCTRLGRAAWPVLPEPSTIFVHTLQRDYNVTLQRGYLVRDRVSCLFAAPIVRKKTFAGTFVKPTREQLKILELQSIARGETTEAEYRSKGRKLAAKGSPKHVFVSIGSVRFLGELYNAGLLPLSMVRDWLRRLLVDTARPEMPSEWELECACALLITCGHKLERDVSDCVCNTGSRSLSVSAPRHGADGSRSDESLRSAGATTPVRASDDSASRLTVRAPKSHWVHCAPPPSPGRKAAQLDLQISHDFLSTSSQHASGCLSSAPADCRLTPSYQPSSPLWLPTAVSPSGSDESVSGGSCTCDGKRILDMAMGRLVHVCTYEEVDHKVKQWVLAVVTLRDQKWHPLATMCAAKKTFLAASNQAKQPK